MMCGGTRVIPQLMVPYVLLRSWDWSSSTTPTWRSFQLQHSRMMLIEDPMTLVLAYHGNRCPLEALALVPGSLEVQGKTIAPGGE